jgi:hypothetical protein
MHFNEIFGRALVKGRFSDFSYCISTPLILLGYLLTFVLHFILSLVRFGWWFKESHGMLHYTKFMIWYAPHKNKDIDVLCMRKSMQLIAWGATSERSWSIMWILKRSSPYVAFWLLVTCTSFFSRLTCPYCVFLFAVSCSPFAAPNLFSCHQKPIS